MSIPDRQRQLVRSRAGNCCEYCRLPESGGTITFHIDHIRPIKHKGSDNSDNLCLACYNCNRYKGDNIAGYDPESDNLTTLYHPRQQRWDDHFLLQPDYSFSGKTPIGRTTIDVLRINEESLIQQRQVLSELGMYPCIIQE